MTHGACCRCRCRAAGILLAQAWSMTHTAPAWFNSCLTRRAADSQDTGGLRAHLLGLARIHIVQVLPKLVRPLYDSRLRALRNQRVLTQPASKMLAKAAVPQPVLPQQQHAAHNRKTEDRVCCTYLACGYCDPLKGVVTRWTRRAVPALRARSAGSA